jgi:hypothetical protein
MEQVLRILKQLMGTGGMLGDIPKPIKIAVLYFSVFVGVYCIFKFGPQDPSTKTFLIIALIVLAIITGVYFGWKWWSEKKQNQEFGGVVSQSGAVTPRGLSDPGQRARLDDLRKKFQSGVEAYKSRGKDLYKLPWYVIVGEPGSGKTEAIRHSNVGFPPGMQDELQGVGGTINMNWWFTNHAVLLDTAGRLMFEEIKPGETSEWKEFLTQLKKSRPNCPINGLFLVIPSDSLIKDSADAIQKKAGKIAQQLDVIQRVLDVRFPVFVVVTKCDKINGFREFFDGLTDPMLQHQMMGWSNPDQLDEPFKPELVASYLDKVAARLRRRRLGLMRDPVPENPDVRRTDEVDTLYSLPYSMETLGSRLKRYLETIFIAGEWSAKPLFLRGIYFSSAMREGSALDAELAEAIGVGIEDLPDGKIWERERAYFLRDLFIEKVFREKGLVTRATNTRHMLRNQKIALYACGIVALGLAVGGALFAKAKLEKSVTTQRNYWQAVSTAGWEGEYWKPIVQLQQEGLFSSAISTNAVTVETKMLTLGQFHSKLRDLTETPMQGNFMLPRLADNYNKSSKIAQQIVFEASVVRPLLDATRQKMSQDKDDQASAQFQAQALAALIQIESDIISNEKSTNAKLLTLEQARDFLGTFENYVAGTNVFVDTNLVAVMSWTYTTNTKVKWPSREFSGSPRGTNTLEANARVRDGLKHFLRNATNAIVQQDSDWEKIKSLRDSVRDFAERENALFAAVGANDERQLLGAQRAVYTAQTVIESKINELSHQRVFRNGILLSNAQHAFVDNFKKSAVAALDSIRQITSNSLRLHGDCQLFRDIDDNLNQAERSLTGRIDQLLKESPEQEFQALDQDYLANNAFRTRVAIYRKAETLSEERRWPQQLPGSKEQLEKAIKEVEVVRDEAASYTGKLASQAKLVASNHLARAERIQSDAFFRNYLSEAKNLVSALSGFPLIATDVPVIDVKDAAAQIGVISTDLVSSVFTKFNADSRPDWAPFVRSIRFQQKMTQALQSDDGVISCSIILAQTTPLTKEQDEWRGSSWRDMEMLSRNGKKIRTSPDEIDLGTIRSNEKIDLLLTKNRNIQNSPTVQITTKEWGPLYLIYKYKGRKDGELNSWIVEFPDERLGSSKMMMRLRLKFARALPDLDNWPKE